MMKTSLRPRTGFNARSILPSVACLAMALGGAVSSSAQTATPQPVIVADFNHDGIPDALVLSTTAPTGTIAFGSVPYGTFSASSKVVTFPAGCTALPQGSVLAGDFNGDGLADLAFFCGREATGVMLGKGDGTFGAPSSIFGIISSIAALGDFNHDGKLDIVAVGSNGIDDPFASIIFFAGNGDGTFANSVTTGYTSTSVYTAVVIADVNGDGYPDIVAANFTPDTPPSIDVFGNNKDGTFGTAGQNVGSPNTTVNIGASAASSILAGNFFNTGKIDFIVPGTGANPALFALQNTSPSNSYSFADPVTIASAGLLNAQAGSFTGGPATDLIVANGTNLSVLANDGAGNFAATYATLTLPSTSGLFAVADANGDGYSDIYTATSTNGALSLAANVTTGSASATSQAFSLGSTGTKIVSAAWNGNVNLLASTATGQQIVSGAMSATTVASSKNPSLAGDIITFSASVGPPTAGQTPTGSVIFSDGTTTLATVALSATATATYATGTLTQASHSITAAYSGDSFYAPSISPVLLQVVNHAPAVASNLTWATPAAIVYGTALSTAQLNAVAVDANGAAIPGNFAYTPAAGTVLDAGVRALSVAFMPADPLSFLPATRTVTLTVTQVAPVLTWATPASIAYGVPLSATQLNATAAGVGGAALPGNFTYTPAAGTVLSPGTQALSVSFAPANAVDYTSAAGTVNLVVTSVSIASFTPNTVVLGAPATTITLTGAGFVATSIVQVNGTGIPSTLVNTTTLTAIVPASYFTKVGTLQITVADPGAALVSPALTLTVAPPSVAATITAPPTTPPGSQTTVTVTLSQPYPIDLVGTLTIGFTRSTSPQLTDPSLQFAEGGTKLSFPIPANTTTIPPIELQAGTIAGTITVPLTLTAGTVDVTPANLPPVTIVVPPAVPSVSSMTLTRSGDHLTVVMHGFSNTREVVSAKFHFTAATGATIGTPDLTLPADTIFNTNWFDTDPSDAYGSTFTYTQIFNTSDGSANIGSVDATLTNTVGDSTVTTAK